MFIHHEDLRRGDGIARPRDLTPEDEETLWQVLTGTGRLAFRKSKVGIVVDAPGHERVQLHQHGDRTVTLRGAVGEVLLAAYGRARAAEVEVDGNAQDVAALGASALGLDEPRLTAPAQRTGCPAASSAALTWAIDTSR